MSIPVGKRVIDLLNMVSASAVLARFTYLTYWGIATAARIPIMATTIMISIKVKPLWLVNLLNMVLIASRFFTFLLPRARRKLQSLKIVL